MICLQDVLMVKRQNKENMVAVKDMLDDLKALCCKGRRSDMEECYICDEVNKLDQVNWCSECNSYFCNVSLLELTTYLYRTAWFCKSQKFVHRCCAYVSFQGSNACSSYRFNSDPKAQTKFLLAQRRNWLYS